MKVHAVGRSDVPPLEMPARFKHDVAYFMTPAGDRGAPELGRGEYWINLEEATVWLSDGVVCVISPLDSEKTAELQLSEEQEEWLEWIVKHNIQHIRLGE